MAEAALSVVIEGALREAISLVTQEISLVWSFKRNLQKLAKRLKMIQAFLSDAESKQVTSKVVELWLKKLEIVAFDADDVLDEFAYEVLREKGNSSRYKVRNFFSASNPVAFSVKMGHKIENINSLLDDIYKESGDFGLTVAEVINSTTELKEIYKSDPFMDNLCIMERDDNTNRVVEILTGTDIDKALSFFAIEGLAGIGKRTLAQLVYKNVKIVKHFDERFWVSISDDFSVDRILNEMLQSITEIDYQMTNTEALVKKLTSRLKNKRYLIVFDDVWDMSGNKWDTITNCLRAISGSKGSKVMVTTRHHNGMRTSHIYRLQPLSKKGSWSLFKQIAFADGGASETPQLVKIGLRIVQRCYGVPLAIKVLGGLLYPKKDEHEWSVVEKLWEDSNILGIKLSSALEVTYNQLPSSSIKQCFAYCSIFKKDIILEKNNLVQLWMAQGFINTSNESHLEMEDIGSNYISMLLQYSLLQNERNPSNRSTICSMHGLVQDLAFCKLKHHCSIMGSKEFKSDNECIHLSLISKREEPLSIRSSIMFPRLRTFYSVGNVDGLNWTSLKRLRALILDDSDLKNLSEAIGKLKHLRYLDITKTQVTRLPDSISKLYYLQTLRLPALDETPKKFGNLVNLRHLYILKKGSTNKSVIAGLGRMVSLQTLSFFIVHRDGRCQIEELRDLSNLKGDLKIYGLENLTNSEEARKANLPSKAKIENLELYWELTHINKRILNVEDVLNALKPHSNVKVLKINHYAGSTIPSWMSETSQSSTLRNLVHIRLFNLTRCEQIPSLGHLPYLEIVEMRSFYSLKCIGTEFYGPTTPDSSVFPALRKLKFEGMPSLLEWTGPENQRSLCPNLEELKILSCPELTSLPDMNSLTSLQSLSISDCKNITSLPDMNNLLSLRSLFISKCNMLSRLPVGIESLVSLEEITIWECHILVSIPDIHGLQSLRKMSIGYCEKLSEFPRGIEACMSLIYLNICSNPAPQPESLCVLPSLKTFGLGGFSDELDHFPWPYSVTLSLTSLSLYGWSNVTSLPDKLRHMTSLTYLEIQRFDGLEILPEWVGEIQSLKTLCLHRCNNLKYLPSSEAMRLLVNLELFQVIQCPLLEQRCTIGTGPEWNKISHFLKVDIRSAICQTFCTAGQIPSFCSRQYASS